MQSSHLDIRDVDINDNLLRVIANWPHTFVVS